jgi:protein TonB
VRHDPAIPIGERKLMATRAPMSADDLDLGHRRRRHGRGGFNWPLAGVIVLVAVIAAIFLLRGQTITERPGEEKITRVVLPPPPPPPPPPEVKPEEKPPEPKAMPIEQPVTDTPPPPTPQADSAPGDDALSAREGAGPSSYGLAIGDGSGSRIANTSGRGIGGFNRAAYASYLEGEIRRALESNRTLRAASLRARARVWIDANGRITRVEVMGSDRADDVREALVGRSVRPPDASLAMPVALSLDIRRAG